VRQHCEEEKNALAFFDSVERGISSEPEGRLTLHCSMSRFIRTSPTVRRRMLHPLRMKQGDGLKKSPLPEIFRLAAGE